MAISEAKKRANKKWNEENQKNRYDRIQLVVLKGKKDIIKSFAKCQHKSINGFVNEAIDEKIERDKR